MDQRIQSFLADVLALAGEEPDAVPGGVRRALAKCEAFFRLQEPKKRTTLSTIASRKHAPATTFFIIPKSGTFAIEGATWPSQGRREAAALGQAVVRVESWQNFTDTRCESSNPSSTDGGSFS